MYPHERSLVKRFAEVPFELLGVNSDGDRESIRKIVKEKDLTWRSWWNGPEGPGTEGGIAERWSVFGWPKTYVLDHQGVIRFEGVFGEELDRAIETLLTEMGVEVPPPLKEGHGADR